jgi:hypothetical protein
MVKSLFRNVVTLGLVAGFFHVVGCAGEAEPGDLDDQVDNGTGDESGEEEAVASTEQAATRNCSYVKYCNRNGFQVCVRNCKAGCSVTQAVDECRREIRQICGNVKIRSASNWTCS